MQAQILNLFKRLHSDRGISYLFITHDLAVVRQIVDRIYVLYRGEIVEHGQTEEVMMRATASVHATSHRLDPRQSFCRSANGIRTELTIGALPEQTGAHGKAIRHDEREGLRPSAPCTAGGHQVFHEARLRRLFFIRRSRELGFSETAVQTLLGSSMEGRPVMRRDLTMSLLASRPRSPRLTSSILCVHAHLPAAWISLVGIESQSIVPPVVARALVMGAGAGSLSLSWPNCMVSPAFWPIKSMGIPRPRMVPAAGRFEPFHFGLAAEAVAALAWDHHQAFAADLSRLRGVLSLHLAAGRAAAAEADLCEALTIAREQELPSLELRAATSLARLWRDQGRRGPVSCSRRSTAGSRRASRSPI